MNSVVSMAAPAAIGAIPVVILCGGQGIYLPGSSRRNNKALVEIDGEPMVVWVMRSYVAAGFRHFILAAGGCAPDLAPLFVRRYPASVDSGLPGPTAQTDLRFQLDGVVCRLAIRDTGAETATGERIRRVAADLATAPVFAVTYSDTLCDIDLAAMYAAHRQHGRLATMMATQAPTRFRILGLRPGDPLVRGFLENPLIENDPINGGFYLFQSALLGERYLGRPDPEGAGVLETTVLERLVEDRQLVAYPYGGAWHYLDSERDIPQVEAVARKLGIRTGNSAEGASS